MAKWSYEIEAVLVQMEYDNYRSMLTDKQKLTRDIFRVNPNKLNKYLKEHPEYKETILGIKEYSAPFLATKKKKE